MGDLGDPVNAAKSVTTLLEGEVKPCDDGGDDGGVVGAPRCRGGRPGM